MKAMLQTDDGWAGLILRLTLGLVMLPHGAQKLMGLFGGFGFDGTIGFFTQNGTRPEMAPPLARGAFLTPADVTGLAHGCRFVQEEIFGPVVSVDPFADEDAAVSLANDVRYGLSASVWTRDLARAHRVSARLETGMVWVNTWLLRDLRVPFGGIKASGVCREGGRWSLEFFSEARNICIQLD